MGQPQNWAQIIINWFPVLLLIGAWGFLIAHGRASKRRDVSSETKGHDTVARGTAFLVIVVALWLFGLRALSRPWEWTGDQVAGVALSVCIGFIAVGMGRIWWAEGYSAVKARLARVGQRSPSASLTWKNALLCAVMGAALVLLFLLAQQAYR